MLAVHQPASSKHVGDLFSYVGATASAAWHARLDAAAARELDAVSTQCGVNLLFKTTVLHAAEELCSIRQVAHGMRCQLGQVFSNIGDADQQSACGR